jgi:hypothetical protein
MQQRVVQWVTSVSGILFMTLGGLALFYEAHLDGAVWFILGGELVVLGTANQRSALAPWRVVAVWLLPIAGFVLMGLHLLGWPA